MPLLQFVALGGICVLLNTGADLLAVLGSTLILRRANASAWMRRISGSVLLGLGIHVAFGADGKR
jgi:threonine/homoserine/homoserine lactone efflux protein